jgi:hypothetical protein
VWITGDGFYAVGMKINLVETSFDYYPVAHSRHLGANIRKVRIATLNSKIIYSNQCVTVIPRVTDNQRTTVITLK